MMRGEDDNGCDYQKRTSPTRKKNPLLWTVRSARRVGLAVRTSIDSSVAKKALFEEEESQDEMNIATSTWEENANIDQAMMGLYNLPNQQLQGFNTTLFHDVAPSYSSSPKTKSIYDVSSLLLLNNNNNGDQASSYIPQDDWDPMLDGGFRDAAAEKKSQELIDAMSNYEASNDWKMALALLQNNDDNLLPESSLNSSKNTDGEINGENDDDDAFGDFQSADTCASPKPASTYETENGTSFVRTPPRTHCHHEHTANEIDDEQSLGSVATCSTINTVGLVRRVDDLFSPASCSMDEHDLYSTLSSNDMTTPALLAQTHGILARVAQENEGSKLAQGTVNARDDDADSDATPTTRSRRTSLSYATPSRQLSKEFAASKRISMRLPVTDLTIQEGRWTRRRQLEWGATCYRVDEDDDSQTELSLENLEQILNGLPELYQIPLHKINDGPVEANAAVIRILNSVPWGCVNLDEQNTPGHDLSVWDDFITGQLSELDSALQDVQKIMAASVNPEKLNAANDLVHTCDRNLRLAKIYWDRSSQALEAAEPGGGCNGVGILGYAQLLDLWQEKEDFTALEDILGRLGNVTTQEQEIIRRIDTFDATHSRAQDEYAEVMKLCKKLRGAVDGNLGRLESLSELRDSRLTLILEERFWDRLKYLSQQNVVRVCRKRENPSLEYTSLVKAAHGLFEASQSNCPGGVGLSNKYCSEFDEFSGWSKNIVDAIAYETERCFAIALLEPSEPEDSEFVKDLRTLEQEIGRDWGDSAKLKTLTHNLVTIRFDFERSMCYLPRVMVRLCECLCDILRAHSVFHQIHCPNSNMADTEAEEDLAATTESSVVSLSIEQGLRKYRVSVWEKCESIMIYALREYQNFASKTVLFRGGRVGTDASTWEKELQGLHTVFSAIVWFLGYKNIFHGNEVVRDVGSVVKKSRVLDVFEEIASEHLRVVHVEAMTSMGRMLARETWYLVDMAIGDDAEKKTDQCGTSPASKQLLFTAISSAVLQYKGLASFHAFTSDGSAKHLGADSEGQHQSLLFQGSTPCDGTVLANLLSQAESSVGRGIMDPIFDSIDTSMKAQSDNPCRISTQSITDGLVEWVSRLVLVSLKVPVVSEKVCYAVENVFDLYFTTIFRLCAGSRRNERIILGEETSTAGSEFLNLFPSDSKRATSPLMRRGFGQERRASGKPPSAPYRTNATISSTLDIETCAPMPKDTQKISKARQFIDRAQQELHGKVNLNRVDSWIGDRSSHDDPEEYACAVAKSLERREAASWSCLVAIGLAEVVRSVLEVNLEGSYGTASYVQRFRKYVELAAEAIPVLSRKASDLSCTRAFSPFGFVKEIVQVGGDWEESKLHEQPNDYVEDLCERACLIWGFVAASGKLPRFLVAKIWANLQSATYLTLIEGFSRVMHCSTEGRALMALDLASVSSNLRREAVRERLESFDLPFEPPSVSPRYGKQYVDFYVKVYYYPQEDALTWIAQNYQQYRLDHMLSLLSSGFGGRNDQSKEFFERIKKLYE